MDQQEIRKKFDTLPQALKSAIANLEMGEITDGLRQKYNLHVDQLGKIAEEITLTMVGLTRPSDFNRNIKAKTGLADDVINLITYDLNQQIFSKIRAELEELTQAQNAPAQKEGSVAIKTPSSPQVFNDKMNSVANVPKQEIAVNVDTSPTKTRDPYRESI